MNRRAVKQWLLNYGIPAFNLYKAQKENNMTGYKSKRAAAQNKLTQPEQEPVAWLEPEWGEKICPEVGYEVTMTDDHPKDLGWIPLYPPPPQGEIVAYLVLFEGAGKLLEFTKGNYIHGAKVEHGPLYTTPPQRPWVDLTEDQIKVIEEMALTKQWAIRMTIAQLKECNA
jgi:hypothetical protein